MSADAWPLTRHRTDDVRHPLYRPEEALNHALTTKLMGRMERIEEEVVAAIDDLKAVAEKDEQASDLRQRFSNILKEQAAVDRLLRGMRQ